MHVTDNRHRLGSACGVRRRSQQAIPASPKLHCHRRAEVQFGLIHRSQALAEGMTERMVDWCLLTGDWFVSLPGVYALRGSTPCWLRDEMGAVLWAGPYAAASGRAAGALWGLIIDGTFIARLDVAWPELKVGIEVDSRRHTRRGREMPPATPRSSASTGAYSRLPPGNSGATARSSQRRFCVWWASEASISDGRVSGRLMGGRVLGELPNSGAICC